MSKDNELINFFMDDGLLFKKQKTRKVKKAIEEKENTIEIPQTSEVSVVEEVTKNVAEEEHKISKEGFGEVDYAILKAITYDFKTTKEIAKALKIRNVIIERHIYKLIKEGLVKYFQYAVLTSKGKLAIKNFENNPEDVWKPIDEYIVSVIKRNKERSLKFQRAIDFSLLVSVIILIILIIYFGIFY